MVSIELNKIKKYALAAGASLLTVDIPDLTEVPSWLSETLESLFLEEGLLILTK